MTDVAQAEELVHSSKEDDEDREEEPGSEGWAGSQSMIRGRIVVGKLSSLLQGTDGSSVLGTHAATSGTALFSPSTGGHGLLCTRKANNTHKATGPRPHPT